MKVTQRKQFPHENTSMGYTNTRYGSRKNFLIEENSLLQLAIAGKTVHEPSDDDKARWKKRVERNNEIIKNI